jgi:hypothetical protein
MSGEEKSWVHWRMRTSACVLYSQSSGDAPNRPAAKMLRDRES